MLTSKELGAAIEEARRRKGVTKKALADAFGIKPPSVQDWVNNGTVDKALLDGLWMYFADVAGPEHWGLNLPAAWSASEKPLEAARDAVDSHASLKARLEKAFDPSRHTQKALAAAAKVAPPSVSDWFKGETLTLKAEPAVRAAKYLGVEPLWLVCGEGPMQRRTAPQIAQEDVPAHPAFQESLPKVEAAIIALGEAMQHIPERSRKVVLSQLEGLIERPEDAEAIASEAAIYIEAAKRRSA